MILGIGTDTIDIRRIERTLAHFGDRFTMRIFTETERARAERRPSQRAATYAKRFAAKEACSKALGTGLKRGVFWRDMGVANMPSGQPTLRLTGGAAVRLAQLTPAGHIPIIHISLTDDYPLAVSFVIISAELSPMDPG
ncbi:MAG: holo-ACP synthase [Terricaulis sp.]